MYVPDAMAWHYLHREFLDPAWVRRRAVRHGLEWGIRRSARRPTQLGDRSCGPRWAWRTRISRDALLRLLGGEARRFEAAYHEDKWRGRWDGLWLGRQWNQLPQLVANVPREQSRQAA